MTEVVTHAMNHPSQTAVVKPLMQSVHEGRAAATAQSLGAAAAKASMSRSPQDVPGFLEALGGLSETDPLTVKVYAAYVKGYDAAVPA